MTSGGTQWYVVQTHPNSEATAEAHLRRQGFQTYLPRYRKKRRHARRREEVLSPLFPRYLFVALDVARHRWRTIQSTLGVTRLVTFGDMPTALREGVIDHIREREAPDGVINLSCPPFTGGDPIEIANGPLGSCKGLFDSIADKERVTVLLEMLGRKTRVVLDLSSVLAT